MSAVGQPAAGARLEGDGVGAILERGGPPLRELMARTERHLERVTVDAGAPLAAHANATVAAGGKRLRPLLVVLAAQSAGGPARVPDGEERLVRAAVAVELVHSATLVHDDVIDGAQLRRGRPTVAAAAGRGAAVATGDLLFSRAFAELARNDDAAQLQALSQASSALAEGELLQREDAYAAHVAVERYLRRCELKTAALFEAACRLGALTAARGSLELAGALGGFARQIGLAFQLLDDVLDVSGPVERTGKSRGTDLLDGTVTLPFILARERDESLAEVRPATGSAARARRRRCASGSPRQARSTRRASARWGSSRKQRRRCRRSFPAGARSCSSSSPTRSSSGIGEARRARLEVAREDQVRLEGAREELDFLGHVRVRHPAQVAEQRARAAVELVVEPFDGGLVEDALAARLALRAAQHDPPVPRAFLGPVERVDKLAGAVEADVQLARGAGRLRKSVPARPRRPRPGRRPAAAGALGYRVLSRSP